MVRPLRLLLSAALVTGALTAATGGSAVGTPVLGQVRPLSIVGASTSSLTLRWPAVADATSYEVELATNLEMTDRHLVATPGSNSVTVGPLDSGRLYCFQARAVSKAGYGLRSPRTCKPTILAQGPGTGPTYRLLTYNICTRACPDWSSRRRPAARLMKAAMPDVIALQENQPTSRIGRRLRTQFKMAASKRAITLFIRKSRFALVRTGTVDTGPGLHPWAVWAELADRSFGYRRVIVVSSHSNPGPDTAASDGVRGTNAHRLINGVRAANPQNLPVLYLGDYNSHRHRTYFSTANEFHQVGHYDAYDLAQSLWRPNYSSMNGGSAVPRISNTYGDHVDHVWVDPYRTRVLGWANVARIENGRYSPLPSDHNPILVTVQVG